VALGAVITCWGGWKAGMTHAVPPGGVLSNDFVALVLAFSNTGEAAHLRHLEEPCA
jgi:hypothetical protein